MNISLFISWFSLLQKLSIIGYTEFKSEYENNTLYRFRHNFFTEKDIVENTIESLSMKQSQSDKKQSSILNFDKTEKFDRSDREVNIRINVKQTTSTSSLVTDCTEGLPTNKKSIKTPERIKKVNSYYKAQAINGSDFIVFGNEKYNKNFDKSDADKLIMSESKGNLIENEKKCIKYIISTYKGQSGSPIFLRVKNRHFNNMRYSAISNESEAIKKHFYSYHFIGLHSRRGPLDEKLEEKLETYEKDTEADICLENKYNPYDQDEYNKIAKIHKFSNYNAALSVIGSSTKNIIEVIKENNNIMIKQNKHFMTPASDFISVKIILNDEEKLSGLFKKSSNLFLIFELGGAILNVPKEFVLLQEITNQNISEIIQNFTYDMYKQLQDLLEYEDSTSLVFDLRLNIKTFGEVLTQRIFDKFIETYQIKKDDFKKMFITKYSKKFFQLVFSEIIMFENTYPLYGLLYNKIKHTINALADVC